MKGYGGAVHDMMTLCSGMYPVCSPEEIFAVPKELLVS